MTAPPDIVLFLTDQQRFDQVGYASGGHFETPNIDRLARSGVIFETAYSASTVCVPARVALMTGFEPNAFPPRRTRSPCGRGSGPWRTSCGAPVTRRRSSARRTSRPSTPSTGSRRCACAST